jgi:hypothetical protein
MPQAPPQHVVPAQQAQMVRVVVCPNPNCRQRLNIPATTTRGRLRCAKCGTVFDLA